MVVICWARSCSANAVAMSKSLSRSSSYSASLISWRSRPCELRLHFRIGLGVVDRLKDGGSDNRSYVDALDGGTDGKLADSKSIADGGSFAFVSYQK